MDAKFWTKKLREVERELDAATRLSDVNAAAKRLMLAKAELRRLEALPRNKGRVASRLTGAAARGAGYDSPPSLSFTTLQGDG